MTNQNSESKRKKVIRFMKNHTKKVVVAGITGIWVLTTSQPAFGIDPAIPVEAGKVAAPAPTPDMVKGVVGEAMSFAKSKPGMSLATAITCLACVPAAGASASPGLCIACGILIAKTLG
jgi:hypothetical protein